MKLVWCCFCLVLVISSFPEPGFSFESASPTIDGKHHPQSDFDAGENVGSAERPCAWRVGEIQSLYKKPLASSDYLNYEFIAKRQASCQDTDVVVWCCDQMGLMICPDPFLYGAMTREAFYNSRICRRVFFIGIGKDLYMDKAAWHNNLEEDGIPYTKRPKEQYAYMKYAFIKARSVEERAGQVTVRCCRKGGLVFCPDPLDRSLFDGPRPYECPGKTEYVHISKHTYMDKEAWHQEQATHGQNF